MKSLLSQYRVVGLLILIAVAFLLGTATTAMAQDADLTVNKTGPASANQGSNITYTVTVESLSGSSTPTNTLSDSVPANTSFVSESHPAGWNCSAPAAGATSGTITCTNGNPINVGETSSFTFVFQVSDVPNGTSITNVATISHAGADPNPENNSSSTTAFVGNSADLTVNKTGPASATPGSNITYTVTVESLSGSSTPTNTLSDSVPANTSFVSESHPAGWNCSAPAAGATSGTITCTSGNPINVGETYSFTFVFQVGAGVPNGASITNVATISHAGVDPSSENNSSSTTAFVGSGSGTLLAPHDVLISEFRLSGPGGNSDEYIEFYCNRDTDCNLGGSLIRAFDPALRAGTEPSEGDFTYAFPPNTIIPARQYLLVADLGQYSLNGYATPDFNVNNPSFPDFFIDNEGLQLVGSGEPVIIDSVGFIGGGNDTQYIEGTGLARATSRPADQYAYVRRRETGLPYDTDNNANDFVLVSVTGAAHTGITAPPVLGAPGPQSLSSAKSYNNAQITGSTVEPAVGSHTPPNWVRVGVGDTGTLSIRRTITNNTNQTFDYIRFRVIDIPTLNSPNPGGNLAQLRLVTSSNAEVFTNSQARVVVIRGTILEYDAGTEPVQPNGGGLNSTVRANLSEEAPLGIKDGSFSLFSSGLLGPGQKLDVQFLLNVVKAGEYRFYVFVEARSSQVLLEPAAPRQLINLRRAARAIAPGNKRPKTGSIMPTKSTLSPARVWIAQPVFAASMESTPARSRRAKRKVRIRRRSSAALRARAEAKYRAGTSAARE